MGYGGFEPTWDALDEHDGGGGGEIVVCLVDERVCGVVDGGERCERGGGGGCRMEDGG